METLGYKLRLNLSFKGSSSKVYGYRDDNQHLLNNEFQGNAEDTLKVKCD